MADRLQVLEDILTCSICFEIFNEPVTLPCNHSYCRECLQVYAAKSKDNTDSPRQQSGAEAAISCPQCRVITDLGVKGVAGLSADTHLVQSLPMLPSAKTLKETSPLCSLCEDENKAEAVTFCQSCYLLYCEQCLPYHPMRGDLKQHVFIPLEDYVYLSTIRGRGTETGRAERTPSCELHKKPYTIYCMTCHTVICSGCLSAHHEHTMGDIQVACENLKAPLHKKTEKCEGMQFELNESLAGLKNLEKDIQRHEGLQKTEIFKAYNRALESLNTWRNKCLNEIEVTHTDWYSQCRGAVKDLEMKSEEMASIMITSQDVLSSTNVVFLQTVQQLNIRIDSQLSEIRNSLKTHIDVKTKLQSALDLEGVASRELTVKEKPRCQDTQHALIFNQTSSMGMKISENGSLMRGYRCMSNKWCTTLTDGLLQSGHITWALEITVTPFSNGYACNCLLGVVREGCTMSSYSGTTPWCIGMQTYDDTVTFYIPGKCRGDVTSGYDTYTTYTGQYRLGFSLNCNERTLTVSDFDNNHVMATVRDVDLSQPVSPAVGFKCGNTSDSVSVRIIPWHCSILH